MHVVVFLVAHGQAAEAGYPGMGAFNDPTVAAQALAAVHAVACDAGCEIASVNVVGIVCRFGWSWVMQLRW